MLALDVPGEMVPEFRPDGEIVTNEGRLEKLGIDSVGFNYPALGKGDIESQAVFHNLLTHSARELRVIAGYDVPFEKAQVIPISRRDAVPLIGKNVGQGAASDDLPSSGGGHRPGGS